MSSGPARIGRVAGQGRPPAVGEPAHLTLVDPAASWVADPAAMATTGWNSALRGRKLTGRVVHTFYAGRATVLDAALSEPASIGADQ
jgi:dihydroorotase